MKLMMNGALTLGTLDGANVEICDAVGAENMFLFGMHTDEVEQLKVAGYRPGSYYDRDPVIHRAIDQMYSGFEGCDYHEIASSLTTKDPYMVLADFADYCRAQEASGALYRDQDAWARVALLNTAKSGVFAADRAIRDYNERIWHVKPVKW